MMGIDGNITNDTIVIGEQPESITLGYIVESDDAFPFPLQMPIGFRINRIPAGFRRQSILSVRMAVIDSSLYSPNRGTASNQPLAVQ